MDMEEDTPGFLTPMVTCWYIFTLLPITVRGCMTTPNPKCGKCMFLPMVTLQGMSQENISLLSQYKVLAISLATPPQ